MTESEGGQLLDLEGPAAPPRKNGELIFSAPWESRLFGLTLSLHRAGFFAWDEFRQRLIAEIEAWERQSEGRGEWSYYHRWQAAFESLLDAKGLCATEEIQRLTASLAARPHGHDH